MADLSVNFAGLKLKNPLMVSAGPVTGNIEMIKKLVDAGIGTLVTKSSYTKREYEKWVGRKDIFPYKPVYKYQKLKDGTLFSLPSQSDVPISGVAKRIEKMKKQLDIPIIGSILGITPKGYGEAAKILENAGADAIEIDLCCLIPENLTLLKYGGQNASMNPKAYAKIVKTVKKAVSIPVGVKSTLSCYVAPRVIEGIARAKISNRMPDFVTIVGQLDQNPGVDMDTLKPLIPHFCSLGWEGELNKLTYSQVALFSKTFDLNNPFLSASGGIRDYQGVLTSIALGATTVQFLTVVLDKGPSVIKTMIKNLNMYLDEHGISRISDLIGTASKDYIPSLSMGEYMRNRDMLFGTVYASIDENICNGCGLCEEVCHECAIAVSDKKAKVEKEKCRGCNLCVLKCPNNAISLKNFEEIERLIQKYKKSEGPDSFRDFMRKERIGFSDLITLPKKLKLWGFA